MKTAAKKQNKLVIRAEIAGIYERILASEFNNINSNMITLSIINNIGKEKTQTYYIIQTSIQDKLKQIKVALKDS